VTYAVRSSKGKRVGIMAVRRRVALHTTVAWESSHRDLRSEEFKRKEDWHNGC